MSIPYGSREELTTRPYYISSYVFVFDKSKKYDIASMDSPVLKRVKVGFERETPVEDALKMRGMIPGSDGLRRCHDDSESPAVMLDALKPRKDRRPHHLAAGDRRLPAHCSESGGGDGSE